MSIPKPKLTLVALIPTFLIAVLVILILSLSFRPPGCVEAYQFDTEETFVSAIPTSDGIFGGIYNDATGGETAAWHKTGVLANGDQMVFEIRGDWSAWDSSTANLPNTPVCSLCAKKDTVSNCICDPSLPDGNPNKTSVRLDNPNIPCSTKLQQDNPSLCSCTITDNIGSAATVGDEGVYYFSTDYQTTFESLKIGDDQNECKYNQGAGLYVGLFGADGNSTPSRIYHMYSTDEICNITKTDGKCIDSEGVNQAIYKYQSPDGLIFKKDGSEYHKKGEHVKFIIADRYYTDNSGGYGVTFVGGFIRGEDVGLLESIVGSVEEIILGKVVAEEDNPIMANVQNKRVGGAIEYLYNLIVKDSVFILLVQMCLILYIAVFGIFVLSGTIEISRKELTKRLVKIALVIFFTTETSWYFYNQIVVGFFKDGMDYVISIFMTMADSEIDPTSLTTASQLDRSQYGENSTRFTYVDIMIRKLFSAPVSKRILSLVLEPMNVVIMGAIYVMVIYALIFGFLLVMLSAALYYIKILLGLVFVLALGPIFMITVLFDKTDEIFKRWLTYMASQSLQIVSLFLILYLFAVVLDRNFNDLLYFKACTESMNFAIFAFGPYIGQAGRGLAEWVGIFVKIGALLYLLKMIIAKIPGFIGSMVGLTFDGRVQSADTGPTYFGETNKSAISLAGDLLGKGRSAIGSAIVNATPYTNRAANALGRQARSSGLTAPVDYFRNKSPVRGPITLYNDRSVDALIRANKNNDTSDVATREKVLSAAREKGIGDDITLRRLERKMVVEPLKKAIKFEIEKIKKQGDPNVLFDADAMNGAIRKGVSDWAGKDGTRDVGKFNDMMDTGKFQEYINRKGNLTSKEALDLSKGDNAFGKKYLEHLAKRDDHNKRHRDMWNVGMTKRGFDAFKENLSHVTGKSSNQGSNAARERFLRNTDLQDKYNALEDKSYKGWMYKNTIGSVKNTLQKTDTAREAFRGKKSEGGYKDKELAYKERAAVDSVSRMEALKNHSDLIVKQYEDDVAAAVKLKTPGETDSAKKSAADDFKAAMAEYAKQQKAELDKLNSLAAQEKNALEQEKAAADKRLENDKKAQEDKERIDRTLKKYSLYQEYSKVMGKIADIRGRNHISKEVQDHLIAIEGLEVQLKDAKIAYDNAGRSSGGSSSI
ncbi:MAG: type IV secretory pathway VirB6-like protein [Rickettsiales bacterium]|jgi:type IV secretory pathway VirB6-like protein